MDAHARDPLPLDSNRSPPPAAVGNRRGLYICGTLFAIMLIFELFICLAFVCLVPFDEKEGEGTSQSILARCFRRVARWLFLFLSP